MVRGYSLSINDKHSIGYVQENLSRSWLMKTLLTSRCVNQRGAGHNEASLYPSGMTEMITQVVSP